MSNALLRYYPLFGAYISSLSNYHFQNEAETLFHVSDSVSIKQRIALGEDSDILKTNVMLLADIFGDTKMCHFSIIIHTLLFTVASFIVCKSCTYCTVKLRSRRFLGQMLKTSFINTLKLVRYKKIIINKRFDPKYGHHQC